MLSAKFMEALEELATTEECVEASRALRQRLDLLERKNVFDFRPGESVKFVHGGFAHEGTVVRINPKTVVVKVPPKPPFVRGGDWKVPPSLLARVPKAG